MPTKKATPADSKPAKAPAAAKATKAAPAAAKSDATKSDGTKTAAKTDGAKKVNPALMKPLQPSKDLAAIVGSTPLPRSQVVAKVWDYIKKHNLQNPGNKREIVADKKLHPIFGKDKVSMFEMSKHISDHLK